MQFNDINFKISVIAALQEMGYYKKEAEALFKDNNGPHDSSGKPINEVFDYYKNLVIEQKLLNKIESLKPDGGDSSYLFLINDWDGEDDLFNIKSIEGIELLKNLKSFLPLSMIGENGLDFSPLLKCEKLKEVSAKFIIEGKEQDEIIKQLEARGVIIIMPEMKATPDDIYNTEIYYQALELYEDDRFDEALDSIEKALKIEENEDNVGLKINCLYALGNLQELVEYTGEAALQFPGNSAMWLSYARGCRDLELWEKAANAYANSIKNDTRHEHNDESSYQWLGYILQTKLNKKKEAQPYFEKALEMFNQKASEAGTKKDKSFNLFWAAAVLCSLNRVPESLQTLAQAITLDKQLKNE